MLEPTGSCAGCNHQLVCRQLQQSGVIRTCGWSQVKQVTFLVVSHARIRRDNGAVAAIEYEIGTRTFRGERDCARHMLA
jgi:hypothetical protein